MRNIPAVRALEVLFRPSAEVPAAAAPPGCVLRVHVDDGYPAFECPPLHLPLQGEERVVLKGEDIRAGPVLAMRIPGRKEPLELDAGAERLGKGNDLPADGMECRLELFPLAGLDFLKFPEFSFFVEFCAVFQRV